MLLTKAGLPARNSRYRHRQPPGHIHLHIGFCLHTFVEVTMVTGVFAALGFVVKELVFLVSYVKNNAFPQPLSSSEEKNT